MSMTRKLVHTFLQVGLLLLAAPRGAATAGPLIADSVTQFSGTQGLHGWSYGYYDGDSAAPYTPADFEQFPLFDGAKWLIEETGPPIPRGYWTRLTATGGHPNGNITTTAHSANHWAVRRWTSPASALYTITGVLADDSPAQIPPAFQEYNGVVGHIFVDGAEVLSLPINEGGNTNYSLAVPLNTGSIVDFAIDAKRTDLNPNRTADYTDTTTFTVQIFVPEPSTISIIGLACFAWAVATHSASRRHAEHSLA
jgi:hypothetical protein